MEKTKIKTYDDLLALRQKYKNNAQKHWDVLTQHPWISRQSKKKKETGHFQQVIGYIDQCMAIYRGITFGLKLMNKVKSTLYLFRRH